MSTSLLLFNKINSFLERVKMANEAKTEQIIRELLYKANYYNDSDLIVEEQKSDNPAINKLLKNASKRGIRNGYPDFIIHSKKYPDLVIVIEAKPNTNKHKSTTLDNYADYAVDGALLYASFLSKEYDVLAIGISGESKDSICIDHYLYLNNSKEYHSIFSNKILPIDDYFNGIQKSNYKFNQDYSKLITYTKTLNETLHAKKIKESQRALLISGILIALKDRAFRDGYRKHETVNQLVKSLYTAIEGQLYISNIPEKKINILTQAFSFILTNSTLTNNKTGKVFLENLISEIDKEINGFMITYKFFDTVSQFYTEFLRYANNDKGLGIVLTPTHITDLFVELAGVNKDSVVFDNCCGTGGFLISAMKKMIVNAKGDQEKERAIKGKQLIGIEFQDDIYALLISNMIIHHDGRTNIYWGDCFEIAEEIRNNFKPNIGFLNPPYKTKKSDIEEFEFILNNLETLEPGGTCIAIIPISCVIEKTESAINLRKRLLEHHTLEGVLSMPEELFANSKVNTVTCAIVITAHQPHPKGKRLGLGTAVMTVILRLKIKEGLTKTISGRT